MKFLHYFIFFIIFVNILKKLLSRFNNPYILNAYIGKKGSGKSCIGAKHLLKYQKKGWICMTDLSTNIPGVHIIDTINLSKFKPPANTYIWIDEAGLSYDNREFKTTWNKGQTEFWKFQRHYRVLIDISSQAADYDLKLRNLVDNIFLIRRIGHFLTWVRPVGRVQKLTESTSEADSRIADDLYYKWIFSWRFILLPKYWKYQDSYAAPDRPIIPSKIVPCPMLQDFHNGIPDPKEQFYFPYGNYLNISDYVNMKNKFSL